MNKRKTFHEGRDASSQSTKRIRVSRACDQCRAGREKCDGSQPSCHTCETQQRKCSYNEQPKKRGIQPNYIRTLELSLAWLFQTYPDKQNRLARLLSDPNDKAHGLIAFKDSNSSDALHNVWRSSIVSRQIDQLLSGAEVEVPDDSALVIEENGHSVDGLPSPKAQEQNLSMLPEDRLRSPELNRVSYQPSGDADREVLRLPPESWALFEHYTAFTHTWLPIVEKHDILKSMYAYPSEGLSRERASTAEYSELWSIMALAAWQLNEHNENARESRRIARSLIPQGNGPFHISHVKALLLLSLIDVMEGEWTAAWISTGAAIRILAYLNATENSSRISSNDRVKHVCLAAFMLERLVATWTGARMYLHSSQVHSAGLLLEDGLDEWSPWHDPHTSSSGPMTKSPARSISTFNVLVRVAASPHLAQSGLSDVHPDHANLHIILKLLNNARSQSHRIQPSVIVAGIWHNPAQVNDLGNTPAPSQHSGRNEAIKMRFWDNLSDTAITPVRTSYPFIAVPNEGTESISGSTPAQNIAVNPSPRHWSGDDSFPTGSQAVHSGSADIFEELAMLERADSNLHPDFMENLGFGPDLDLAEFFGADYQLTDPLHPQLQSTEFGIAGEGLP